MRGVQKVSIMADLVSDSLNILVQTEAEAEAFVDSVMTSQRVTKVDTPCNNRRKRYLSLPSEVSSMKAKKPKASDGLGRGSEDESKRSDGASDHGDSDREVTDELIVDIDVGASDSSNGAQWRRLHAQKPSARKVIATEAEVHVDSDPTVKQLIAKLSADMHMLYSSLNERMDKFESCLEQKISNKVAQLLDKRVNTELNRIKKEVDANLDSFIEIFRGEISD